MSQQIHVRRLTYDDMLRIAATEFYYTREELLGFAWAALLRDMIPGDEGRNAISEFVDEFSPGPVATAAPARFYTYIAPPNIRDKLEARRIIAKWASRVMLRYGTAIYAVGECVDDVFRYIVWIYAAMDYVPRRYLETTFTEDVNAWTLTSSRPLAEIGQEYYG